MNPKVVAGPWPLRAEADPFDEVLPPAPPAGPAEDEDDDGGGGGGGDGRGDDPHRFGRVVPLGYVMRKEGLGFVFLAAGGAKVVLGARDMHSVPQLSALYGGRAARAWLAREFPRLVAKRDKDGKFMREDDGSLVMTPTGDFYARDLGDALMTACERLGPADALDHRRDGIWPGEAGGIVVHVGNRIWTHPDGLARPFGWRIGNALHLSTNAQPQPADTAATAAECLALMEHFKLWRFAPSVEAAAPVYLMGFVACGVYAAALPWRPHGWLQGPTNAGKSTLLDMVQAMTGTEARSSDVSEAYVRGNFDGRAKLILLDEREPDLAGVKAVLQLMRGASDGAGARVGRMMDGAAKTFTVACPFLLAAISTPAFETQDASRITTIPLRRPNQGNKEAELRAAKAAALKLQPKILTRLIQGWERYEENRQVYRGALMNGNATSRSADQLAALLAGHRTLVDDEAIDPYAAAEEINVLCLDLTTPDMAAEDDAWSQVLAHLLASRIVVGDGRSNTTIAALLEDLRLAQRDAARSDGPADAEATLTKLTKHAGMAQLRWSRGEGLYIGNTSPALNRLFDNTPWANRVWQQALRDVPGAMDGGKVRFRGGGQARCVCIPHTIFDPLPPLGPRSPEVDPP